MGASEHEADTGGLASPRWTHIALRVANLDATIEFYTSYTPLRLLERRIDPEGYAAWMGHPEPSEHPFILVFVQFYDGVEPWSDLPVAVLRPFNHLGFELPSEADVDGVAARARADGILEMEPGWLPDPVGYICVVNDPDGNQIEYSYGQKVYETATRVWGGHTGDELSNPASTVDTSPKQ